MVDEGLGLGWRERWTLLDDGLAFCDVWRWTLNDGFNWRWWRLWAFSFLCGGDFVDMLWEESDKLNTKIDLAEINQFKKGADKTYM